MTDEELMRKTNEEEIGTTVKKDISCLSGAINMVEI